MSRTRLPEGAYDFCWLDCPRPGHRLVHGDREICLCATHLGVLLAGRWRDSYEGAPLPPDSRVSGWPWQDVERAA